MTRYAMARIEGNCPIVTVTEGPENAQCIRILDPGPSQAVINHSPDGFEWGYGGSGPAQLALAILLDWLVGDREVAVNLYQRFKEKFIAVMPHEGGVIQGRTIDNWILHDQERTA